MKCKIVRLPKLTWQNIRKLTNGQRKIQIQIDTDFFFFFDKISFPSLNFYKSSFFISKLLKICFSSLNFAKHSTQVFPSMSVSLCLIWLNGVLMRQLDQIILFKNFWTHGTNLLAHVEKIKGKLFSQSLSFTLYVNLVSIISIIST